MVDSSLKLWFAPLNSTNPDLLPAPLQNSEKKNQVVPIYPPYIYPKILWSGTQGMYGTAQITTVLAINSRNTDSLATQNLKPWYSTSVDYNDRQSAIRRARTPSDQSLLLCVDIVTEQKKLGARRRLGTRLDTAVSWLARLQ